MRNLTVLNLGNNWFSGSMPDWLADLERLRVLNLGSQFGGNNGSKLLGLLGTIPAQVGEMGGLRELVLESNSLIGTLPDALCHKGEWPRQWQPHSTVGCEQSQDPAMASRQRCCGSCSANGEEAGGSWSMPRLDHKQSVAGL